MSAARLNEPVLPDDYPVYADYLYVVDGKVVKSGIVGDVCKLKQQLRAAEIRRCDITGRAQMLKHGGS
jgi:hypothetical protein